MAAINTAMMDFLKGLSASGAVVLGLAIGCMCAFDMGGPVNKAAYVTGTAMLTEALAAGVGTDTYNFGTNFMAAVSAACIHLDASVPKSTRWMGSNACAGSWMFSSSTSAYLAGWFERSTPGLFFLSSS